MEHYQIDWNDSLIQLSFVLREAAGDGGKWLRGLDAFTKAYTSGSTVEEAFGLAIDACEPSTEEREAAFAVLSDFNGTSEDGDAIPHQTGFMAKLKSLATRHDKE